MTARAIIGSATASLLLRRVSNEASPVIQGVGPAAQKNLATLLDEALNELVVVNENSGRRRISKRKAALKQLVNEAAKGNWRALKLLVDILQDIERRSEPQTEESSFSLADEKVLEQLEARLRREKREDDD